MRRVPRNLCAIGPAYPPPLEEPTEQTIEAEPETHTRLHGVDGVVMFSMISQIGYLFHSPIPWVALDRCLPRKDEMVWVSMRSCAEPLLDRPINRWSANVPHRHLARPL